MGQEANAIGLGEWIGALRAELEQAGREGIGRELRFLVGNLELEIEVTTSREGDGRAGIKFWVVEIGGSAKLANTTTQHLKLILKPTGPNGEDLEIADRLRATPG